MIDCNVRGNTGNDVKDSNSVYNFLSTSYLYWLEALSLVKGLPDGIVMIIKLENWLQVSYTTPFKDVTRDSLTNLTRPIRVLIYMRLYMMPGGLPYTTDQLLSRRPFNYIAQPLSSLQRRVLSEKHLRSVFLLG